LWILCLIRLGIVCDGFRTVDKVGVSIMPTPGCGGLVFNFDAHVSAPASK